MAGSAFAHIEPSVAGHYRLNFYAAIYHLLHALRRLGGAGDAALETIIRDHRFLGVYLHQILPHLPDGKSWDEVLSWWQEEIAAWESAAAIDLPLVALSQDGGCGFSDRLALMVASLGEEDSRFGTLFEALQSPLAARRPSLELVGQIVLSSTADRDGGFRTGCHDLLAAGLLDIVNPDAPRSEWTIKLPASVWRMIRGDGGDELLPFCRIWPAKNFPAIGDLILDDALLTRLARLPGLIDAGRIRTMVVRGMPGSDQLRVLGAVARALGRGLAVVAGRAPDVKLLGPLCTMGRYLPVFVYDLAPGETADLPEMPGYGGPLGIVLGLEGGIAGAMVQSAVTFTLPLLAVEQRALCWRDVLQDHAGDDLMPLSERFLLPAGHLRQAGEAAIRHAALDQREIVGIGDVRQACRALNRQMLETHAALLEGGGSWHDLVVSQPTGIRLTELERRCRHRERMLRHLGSAFTASANRGVRALFTGASGTGKTLAAKIIAAGLGIDLYRVDLGAVVNKYIGETEKNLHLVLSRAEALDVILLLDEGDSLLGNRTDVKTSNDRYANLETNFLLQRLESYQGIVIVTTNAAQHIDRAFHRRMDVVVSFVHPQPDERRAIWWLHLPRHHAIGGDFLEEVVQRCALTGGQIRNAGQHATLLAVDEGDGMVRESHLETAIRGEYRKAGATCPMDGSMAPVRPNGMAAFMEAMRI